MTTKKIDTLVEDIYEVFTKPHEISEENLEEFGENIKEAMKVAIKNAGEKIVPHLRMSVIGKPNRQLWYELKTNDPNVVAEAGEVDVYEPNPHKYIKFLFGDIIEHLLVFLTKEAGHVTSHAQEELEIDGVLGHCDPVIDGVPVDIKSASKWSFFKKFKQGELLRGDDPFGYVGQLSGYRERLLELYPDEIDPSRVGWLVMNKESGEICLLLADALDLINAEDRIKEIKEVLEGDEPPEEKCYEPVPDGKSGNMRLQTPCVFCPFKKECWGGLRAFEYSNGIRYLTNVAKLPKVPEVTKEVLS